MQALCSVYVRWCKCSVFEMSKGNGRVMYHILCNYVDSYLIEKFGMGMNGESHCSYLVAEREDAISFLPGLTLL